MNEILKAKSERDLVIMLRDARNRKEELELLQKEAGKANDEIEEALAELLEAQDKKSTAKYEGIGFVTLKKPRLYARFDKEFEMQVFEFLKAENRVDLIKETVNTQSLSSFVTERVEVGQTIPEFIKYYLKRNVAFNAEK